MPERSSEPSPAPAARTAGTALLHSLHLAGISCTPVEIEVDVAPGLPQFIIVGLPDAAVSEARDRVRSALRNSGFRFPMQRVTVNLAPANLRKVGALYDLPIALGILIASRQLATAPLGISCGELALDGRLRPVRGALPFVHHAVQVNQPILLPTGNLPELLPFPLAGVQFAPDLATAVRGVRQRNQFFTLEEARRRAPAMPVSDDNATSPIPLVDFAEITGHGSAKRACEIAAAGWHNLFLSGPPGIGKTMLAQALRSILPPLTGDEAFAVQLIRSAAGLAGEAASGDQPPYRAPHQSASLAALVGGGSQLLPGEISMAHHGVLFLDEAPEFRRDALEALRQPLESGVITIHRAQGSVTYPARCLLVLAQNPCPCGFAGAPTVGATPARRCTCSPTRLQQYSKKISGPLLDRIDLKVFLSDLPAAATTAANETSATIRKRVIAARSRQLVRQGRPNGQLTGAQLNAVITLTPPLRTVLDLARHQGLSLRGQLKTIRVARTIADLETCERVGLRHLQEALAYVLPQETL